MGSFAILWIVLALVSFLLVVGVPIFAALGLPSVLGIYLMGGMSALDVIPSILHRGLASYTLICIPLFILMGEVLARTSIGGRLYTLFYRWLNRLKGNLAIASVGASAIFGAMSGVSVAGAATIGRVAIPEMLKRGYSPALASGSVAAAGSLALLIPPSVGLVLYGEVAGESIGKLFTAALIPGITLAILMMVYLFAVAYFRPATAPTPPEEISWRTRFKALLEVWPAVFLIVAVLGTIYLGVATPTEASGLGAAGAFLVAGIYRELNLKKILEILRSAVVTSGMILLIFAAALLFAYLITRLRVPHVMIGWVAEVNQPRWIILVVTVGFLLIIGMFLDIVSIILITTPIILPIIKAIGFDPLWFGVIMIITCEMAVITPPVGLNLYVIKGIVPEVSLRDIMLGALPFVAVEMVSIVILTVFPILALWLPSLM